MTRWEWASRSPRKTQREARTLLIWLAKSERPVATTAASIAAISGSNPETGLAPADTIAPGAMASMSAWVSRSGAETPMNTSTPTSASPSDPVRPRWFVRAAIQRTSSCRPTRPWWITPRLFATTGPCDWQRRVLSVAREERPGRRTHASAATSEAGGRPETGNRPDGSECGVDSRPRAVAGSSRRREARARRRDPRHPSGRLAWVSRRRHQPPAA